MLASTGWRRRVCPRGGPTEATATLTRGCGRLATCWFAAGGDEKFDHTNSSLRHELFYEGDAGSFSIINLLRGKGLTLCFVCMPL